MRSKMIKTDLDRLQRELSQLEDELADAEDAEELIEEIQDLLRIYGTPSHETLTGSIQKLIDIYLTMQEIGIPENPSVFQTNAIRDAVREALAK